MINWTFTNGTSDSISYNTTGSVLSTATSLSAAIAVLNQLYTAVQNTPSGINTIMVDGMSTTYSGAAQLNAAIDYWTKRVAFLSGTRRRSFGIRMDRF